MVSAAPRPEEQQIQMVWDYQVNSFPRSHLGLMWMKLKT